MAAGRLSSERKAWRKDHPFVRPAATPLAPLAHRPCEKARTEICDRYPASRSGSRFTVSREFLRAAKAHAVVLPRVWPHQLRAWPLSISSARPARSNRLHVTFARFRILSTATVALRDSSQDQRTTQTARRTSSRGKPVSLAQHITDCANVHLLTAFSCVRWTSYPWQGWHDLGRWALPFEVDFHGRVPDCPAKV